MPRLIIDINSNGRTCDNCDYRMTVLGRGNGYCECVLFDIERLKENGDGEYLRSDKCLKAEADIPDYVVAKYS